MGLRLTDKRTDMSTSVIWPLFGEKCSSLLVCTFCLNYRKLRVKWHNLKSCQDHFLILHSETIDTPVLSVLLLSVGPKELMCSCGSRLPPRINGISSYWLHKNFSPYPLRQDLSSYSLSRWFIPVHDLFHYHTKWFVSLTYCLISGLWHVLVMGLQTRRLMDINCKCIFLLLNENICCDVSLESALGEIDLMKHQNICFHWEEEKNISMYCNVIGCLFWIPFAGMLDIWFRLFKSNLWPIRLSGFSKTCSSLWYLMMMNSFWWFWFSAACMFCFEWSFW